ncbi:MAG: MATE family efflux transporter [Lachnospiraceae bacterium]|nr:MATE family efflux transporter [Lachnospiraceae bacterium]
MEVKQNWTIDFTKGSIVAGLVRFSIPLMIGNLLQQFYNIADTLIVGRFIGKEALAAVGSAYTIMVFLTSVILGLCMGSSAFLSIQHGRGDRETFACGNFMAFVLIGGFAVALNTAVYLGMDAILTLLRVPADVYEPMRSYVVIIYGGIMATFLYNYFANSLRAVGNSFVPLLFLGVSALLNIFLDILFVAVFSFGIRGAAAATILSQYVSGIGIWMYAWKKAPMLRFDRKQMRFRSSILKNILSLSVLTSLQQSIMNFGILMVQGLVNSFGAAVMAAFAAAVKVDTFAYSPVQDFGNAFSTFAAQNHGAQKEERIRSGWKKAVLAVLVFCVIISLAVTVFAGELMSIFTDDAQIIQIGISYLRTEGIFYCLIGFLFLFYGYFRAVEQPVVSVILTVISLGTRVFLAYLLSGIALIGYVGIWVSIPIGWVLADLAGLYFLRKVR